MLCCGFYSVSAAQSTQSIAITQQEADRSAAIFLAYFRIGEDSVPQANIRIDQFLEHMRMLDEQNFTVLPLKTALDLWENQQPLPERSVIITFEGAYRSVYETAIPVLNEKGYPYTVFFSSGHINAQTPDYLSWDDLKKIAKSTNGSVGLHPAMFEQYDGDSTTFSRHVNQAKSDARENLGFVPDILSYPYGIYDSEIKFWLKDNGFRAALGQHSGVAYSGAERFALPRFTMTESYASPDRFTLVGQTKPLATIGLYPDSSLLDDANPVIRFSMPEDNLSADIRCFSQRENDVTVHAHNDKSIEIRFAGAIPQDRSRLNCTQNEWKDGQSITRWLGFIFTPKGSQETTSDKDQQDELQELPE